MGIKIMKVTTILQEQKVVWNSANTLMIKFLKELMTIKIIIELKKPQNICNVFDLSLSTISAKVVHIVLITRLSNMYLILWSCLV